MVVMRKVKAVMMFVVMIEIRLVIMVVMNWVPVLATLCVDEWDDDTLRMEGRMIQTALNACVYVVVVGVKGMVEAVVT